MKLLRPTAWQSDFFLSEFCSFQIHFILVNNGSFLFLRFPYYSSSLEIKRQVASFTDRLQILCAKLSLFASNTLRTVVPQSSRGGLENSIHTQMFFLFLKKIAMPHTVHASFFSSFFHPWCLLLGNLRLKYNRISTAWLSVFIGSFISPSTSLHAFLLILLPN